MIATLLAFESLPERPFRFAPAPPISTAPLVMITGASAGVDRATARTFARRGVCVGLLARGKAALDTARRPPFRCATHRRNDERRDGRACDDADPALLTRNR